MNRKVEFESLWKEYADEESDYLIIGNEPLMEYLTTGGFFTAPASTKYHGVYEGGLYDHSKAVFMRLKWITENLNLQWRRTVSPFIIGMFHDLCKCDQYIMLDGKYEYNTNTLLKGHGAKSVMILSQFINLTEEEMLCIRYHMGAYIQDEQTEFDMAIKKHEGVLWTHQADMLASKIDGT